MMVHILDHLDQGIDTVELELHKEESIPDLESKQNSRRKYKSTYDVIEKFVSSDMDIASIDIPSHLDDRNKMLLTQAIRIAAKTNGIKVTKRGDKVYLSKINKED